MTKSVEAVRTKTTRAKYQDTYRAMDDGALSELLLASDEGAWREFLRRFTPVLRHQIGKVIGRARRTLLANDVIDDILGDLHLDLLERDMRKIRIWSEGQRQAKLASWLGLIASQVAIDHVRRAASAAGLPSKLRQAYPNREEDPNRGGEWLGRELNAELGVEPKGGK